MLFGIEYDRGDSVGGYLVPDGHSEVASILVADGADFAFEMRCNELRESVRDARRHDTGLVGFRIDDRVVPNLVLRRNLTIRDARNGLLIYRRLPYMPRVNKKVMRLEVQMVPAVGFDKSIATNFHYFQGSLDKFGHESILQSFNLNIMASIYISGRIMIRNYEEFLDRDFYFISFYLDPYYELATRIYVLSKLKKMNNKFLSDRDVMTFSAAADYFSEIDLNDDDSLRRYCRKIPRKVHEAIQSPYVRQLTCTQPDQLPNRRSVAAAIDILSRFTVVGHTIDTFSYVSAVSELTEISPDSIMVPPIYSPMQRIADLLREIPSIERLLEEDLIFDHYLRGAVTLKDRLR